MSFKYKDFFLEYLAILLCGIIMVLLIILDSWLRLGLGGFAILALDISYRKKTAIYRGFYKNLVIDCSIRKFRSFSLI